MNKLVRQAFTLIELLVVIAIIGILSGLIVVGLSGMTDKANIAKSQIFDNSLRNSLMLNLVTEYRLDGNASDTWGGKNGNLHGTTPVTSGCPQGTCLSFNGTSSDYININGNDAVFNFGSKMTAMVWVKGLTQNKYGFLSHWDDGNNKKAWMMFTQWATPYNKLMVLLSDDGTYAAGHNKVGTSNSVVFDGNWHLVGFTWTSGNLNLYVDGKLDGTGTGTMGNSIYNSDADITIGCFLNSGTAANLFTGSLDEVRLYNEAIPSSQIKEQYYAGLNNLLSSGRINREEYSERINSIANNE